MKVLAFGEILWDLIEGQEHLGGAPFNFAAHIRQCGAPSYIITRLGKDDLGEKALLEIKRMKVESRFVQWDDTHPTGTVDVSLDKGQPSYTIHENVAYDFINKEELDPVFKDIDFDVFYFGSLAQRNKVSADTLHAIMDQKNFSYVFYDANLRGEFFTKDILTTSLTYANILKINIEEMGVISKLVFQKELDITDFMPRISKEYDLKVAIITASEKGCFIYCSNQFYHIEGKEVKVVDAIGAGDSFSASFLYKLLCFNDPVKAAKVANQVGAFVAASRGAIPGYTKEIKEILEI